MSNSGYLKTFIEASRRVGAEVVELESVDAIAEYVASRSSGTTLVPDTAVSIRHSLKSALQEAGVDVFTGNFRQAGQVPAAGVTFCNFGMADTGTVVLESTDENIRLATTLPEVHFVIIDPETILADNLAAVAPMTQLNQGSEPRFIAYITGPSRTADIERVLTIGCHGPRELHILIVESVSEDIMEM
ncbi:LutC/YkgG family protein [Desulfosediminicola flagellatus]|uniref:LutC/YkgG family protein n=1 Tax=Desulfosediminicola flagellatus TaxID=2569541 RepID=UPI0010AB9742|nr:lactate utilization protein [Desulfosediminicola flagellatus]